MEAGRTFCEAALSAALSGKAITGGGIVSPTPPAWGCAGRPRMRRRTTCSISSRAARRSERMLNGSFSRGRRSSIPLSQPGMMTRQGLELVEDAVAVGFNCGPQP